MRSFFRRLVITLSGKNPHVAAAIMLFVTVTAIALAADNRIQFGEKMRGANAPGGLEDTLNRFGLVEHDTDGTHKKIATNIRILKSGESLGTVIAEYPSAEVTFLITDNVLSAGTVTVPTNISLVFEKPGKITKSGAGTLTINGPFSAGLYQVFSGFSAGDVTFGAGSVSEIYPQWWGISGLQAAVTAAVSSSAAVRISGNVSSGAIVIPAFGFGSGVTALQIVGDKTVALNVNGAGSIASYSPASMLISTAGASDFITIAANLGVQKIVFRDLVILGPDYAGGATSGDGVNLSGATVSMITDNVYINGFRGAGKAGMRLQYGVYNHINNTHFNLNHYGLYINGTDAGTASNNVVTLTNSTFRHNVYGAKLIGVSSLSSSSALFESNEKTGLELDNCDNHMWSGGYFEQNNNSDTANEYAVKINAASGLSNQHITFLNTHFSPDGANPGRNRVYVGGIGTAVDVRFIAGRANGASTAGVKFFTIDTTASDTLIDQVDDDVDPLFGVSDAGTRTIVKSQGRYSFPSGYADYVIAAKHNGENTFLVTTKGVRIQPNAPTVASAGFITITHPVTFVSGTTTISTVGFTPPTTLTSATIILIPTGLWSMTAGTNPGQIAKAVTAVVGQALMLTFDSATGLWYPSY